MSDLKKKVEAILFSAGRTVLCKELQRLLHIKEEGLIKETIRELKDDYDADDSPMIILAEGEGDDLGWKLTVKEKFLPVVQKINPHTELSKTILETLAVIAWKHPVLQSEVIRIRTNKAYDHIAELNRLGFIQKKKEGRSFRITVTQKFLDYFDLPDEKDIKEVFKDFKDIEVAVKKKASELSEAEEEVPTEPQPAEEVKSEDKPEEDSPEFETYVDALPDMKKPKRASELEVYDISPKEIAEEAEKELAKEEKEMEEEDSERELPEKEEEDDETTAEKARRLAREIVGEDIHGKKPRGKEEGRKLHPQLEEFIEGSMEHIAPKGTEKHEEEKEERETPDEEELASESEQGLETPKESQKGEPVEEGSDQEDVEAEEYPGQFEKKQGRKEKEK